MTQIECVAGYLNENCPNSNKTIKHGVLIFISNKWDTLFKWVKNEADWHYIRFGMWRERGRCALFSDTYWEKNNWKHSLGIDHWSSRSSIIVMIKAKTKGWMNDLLRNPSDGCWHIVHIELLGLLMSSYYTFTVWVSSKSSIRL